ncbi:hypothetical protein M951_chr1129 (nucleomorph) [Lotharella oceanica]|uniref:Uncharacterized protein n=1 Tax=Lotharella oceanica TaxID=641309 RepID=A0A060DAS2_9EUKA|nr:hypothetical protein M951_chr1129 [Lotharella oceanica]
MKKYTFLRVISRLLIIKIIYLYLYHMSLKTKEFAEQNLIISFIGLKKLDKIIIKKIFKNYLNFEKKIDKLKQMLFDKFYFILINNFNRTEYEDIPMISNLIVFFISEYDSFSIQFYETILFLKESLVYEIIIYLRINSKQKAFILNLNKKLKYFFNFKIKLYHTYSSNPFFSSLDILIKTLYHIQQHSNNHNFKTTEKTFIIFNFLKPFCKIYNNYEYYAFSLSGIRNNNKLKKHLFLYNIGLLEIKKTCINLKQPYILLFFLQSIIKNLQHFTILKNKFHLYSCWKSIIEIKKILIFFTCRKITTAFFTKNKHCYKHITIIKLTKSKYYSKLIKNLQYVCFSIFITKKIMPLILLKFSKINFISIFKTFTYNKKKFSIIRHKNYFKKNTFFFSVINSHMDEWNIIGFASIVKQSFLNSNFKVAKINIKTKLKNSFMVNNFLKKKHVNAIKNNNENFYKWNDFNIPFFSLIKYLYKHYYLLLLWRKNSFNQIIRNNKTKINTHIVPIYSNTISIHNLSFSCYREGVYITEDVVLKSKFIPIKTDFIHKLRFLHISSSFQYIQKSAMQLWLYISKKNSFVWNLTEVDIVLYILLKKQVTRNNVWFTVLFYIR